ncbi:MAG TPA: globin [Acidimicrobiales bacterium]|nr:globin [Acidimicrobiales bacterium]
MPASNMYQRLGGMEFFEALTADFYERVAGDDVLRPLYPEDLALSQNHLCLFLAQFWGGPRLYDELRGHPRLMARHLEFRIGVAERDAWLAHMSAAVAQSGAGPLERAQLLAHFEGVANHLVNC